MLGYINSTAVVSEGLQAAHAHAAEYSLPAPDATVGQLLTTLTASATHPDNPKSAGVIAVSPASSVVGLYLLQGLPDKGVLTCIDPEVEHQQHAKQAFREAGYGPSRIRFLPSRPLDVMGRLATAAYQVIYADVTPTDLPKLVELSWPLLGQRGTLVLANSLLDGTVADSSRNDRATQAALAADEYCRELDGAIVTRLPLGSGLTLVTKL
ncbi:O-methyltransferase [Corynebacterium propinquum]|uniref:O-methyltransferase n=1 Tax=Corynebacterium propinquum TaxID=43769 RepID=A0AAP4BSH7_9CORY|nr:O-methyltransferase [Corynebacterium propinquum]MDK4325590.1 O-methyltransferase [Corynebacterium propinquum]